MASDSLLNVIAGLVKREGRIAREENKKAKEKLKAEQEKAEEEEDEDEDPVGDGKSDAKAAEKEPEDDGEGDSEPEPEDDGEGDSKPTGPDPTLVAQVAAIVKREIEDEEKEKKETELKLSGKKEKIDTKPSIKQEGKMNFREAIRMAVTGTTLTEGYEGHVLAILDDENIKGPLGYEPFFEKGKLFVQKGQERNAQKALKNSGEINKLPKIVGEELEADEYLAMAAVDVDGRCKGFKEALRRLTYEKIKQMKEKEDAKMKKEGVEVDESLELQAIMALDDAGIQADISKKGEVVVKKKDMKKAEAALKKSFAKGKMPKLVGEEVDIDEGPEKDTKGDKEAYQKFFKAALKKFGVDEPDQLKGDKKKEFFDYIDKGWKADNEKPEPGDKKEEVELEEHCGHCEFGLEEKVKYDLYHKTFSDAMQHAYEIAKKQGFVVDPKEIDDKVATGPKKPSSGKTNRYILGTDKKKNLHVQVANLDNKRYELNMYIEGFEPVDEHKGTEPHEHPHDDEELDEKKMSMDARRKQQQRRKKNKAKGKKDPDRMYRVKAAKFFKKTGRTAKDPQAAAKKARKAQAGSFNPPGKMIEKWKEAAFDKVRAIRSRLGEGLDATAARELKLYIENDKDLYKQQIVPIIKNVQRKMKSGKYDHRQAPKLWMYLVDNGAKKYVKEFGGDVKTMFPKDLRLSIANEFANEYKAEIETQGGEMV